jgi:Flp pilus assembly pilin Flp
VIPSSTEDSQPGSNWLHRISDEKGATATEYGVLLSFIVLITMGTIVLLGLELMGWYDELTAYLKLVLGIP